MRRIEKTIFINAPASAVWAALTDPRAMRQWMGEADMEIAVDTDWRIGSPLVVTGSHHGPFRNEGIVLDCVPGQVLRYTHLSSVSDLPDAPENYSVIGFELSPAEQGTALRVVVDHFPTEIIFRHLDLYWRATVELFKAYVESR